VTGAETPVVETDGAAGSATYAKAILNILDDFSEERDRQADSQRAILNILDDFDEERRRVEGANAELLAVNEAMRDFLAVAAHDLRSPLASIVGFASILSANWATLSEEDRRRFVATIERQSQNLARLVDDILTLSSIEGGALTMRPELVALRDAIQRCLDASGGDTASLSVSCPTDLVVWVDAFHLGRILDNYVQNALKYGQPPVRIDASRVGDVVEVRVLDHGPGVPSEFVSSLFAKFTRADTASTRAEKGTGLGLSIVRGLAEANGGEALYEPNAPNGACFIVRLRATDGPGG